MMLITWRPLKLWSQTPIFQTFSSKNATLTSTHTLKLIGFSAIAAIIASSPSKTSAGPGEQVFEQSSLCYSA